FFFTAAHYWTGWLAVGALLLHVAVQLPVVRRSLAPPTPAGETAAGLSRRGLLTAVGVAAGTVTLATVGQTVRPLSRVSVLAPRRLDVGPQRLPVNRSAAAGGVLDAAADPAYRLVVAGPGGTLALSRADLVALPQRTVALPIACVEGWSADAVWTGVRVRDLLALVGLTGDGDAQALVESLQRGGRYRTSVLAPAQA